MKVNWPLPRTPAEGILVGIWIAVNDTAAKQKQFYSDAFPYPAEFAERFHAAVALSGIAEVVQ